MSIYSDVKLSLDRTTENVIMVASRRVKMYPEKPLTPIVAS